MRGRNFLKRKLSPPHPLFKEFEKGFYYFVKLRSPFILIFPIEGF